MKNFKPSGFSLIELVITIAIAAIVLSMAVPSFRDIIANNRIATQTNDFVTDLSFSRSESIKRGVRIAVCTSTNGASCTTSNWEAGHMIFTDENNNGSFDNGSETLLRVGSAIKTADTLRSATFSDFFQYTPSGTGNGTGTFTLCSSGYTGRVITISNTGRLSVAPTAAKCP